MAMKMMHMKMMHMKMMHTTMKMCRFRHPSDLWAHKPNETVWSVGLTAWNERCEAQGLGEGCDPETRAAKLEAILHCGVRGCFVRLSALGTPVDHEWLSRVGWEVFPAVGLSLKLLRSCI